jgi:NADPH:quinone reductase-like Zn-dependent oxidoreductase
MSNTAAWITNAMAKPLKVDSADLWEPGLGEVLVKNAAWAINPVDWVIQEHGIFVQKYPSILGSDSAGEIYKVGKDVKHLKVGQRVIA